MNAIFSPCRMGSLLLLRRALPARSLATKSSKSPLVSTHLCSNGVLQFTFDNEKKLNALTIPMIDQLIETLADAAHKEDVLGVVVIGRGKYYSAGADLSSMLQPMAPSKLVVAIRDQNQRVFDSVIEFPKPIIAAVSALCRIMLRNVHPPTTTFLTDTLLPFLQINGPAIGASVTSATLMDKIIASESASFSLPFAKLGVPPEGCSSVTFREMMGDTNAERILGVENWVPTASEVSELHLPPHSRL